MEKDGPRLGGRAPTAARPAPFTVVPPAKLLPAAQFHAQCPGSSALCACSLVLWRGLEADAGSRVKDLPGALSVAGPYIIAWAPTDPWVGSGWVRTCADPRALPTWNGPVNT